MLTPRFHLALLCDTGFDRAAALSARSALIGVADSGELRRSGIQMRTSFLIPCLLAVSLVACSNQASDPGTPATTPPAAGGGRITGTVTLNGTPAAELVRLDADPQCAKLTGGQAQSAEAIVTGTGNSVQNVFVYIKHGLPAQAYSPPDGAVVLDQQQCRYMPRVLGIRVGQPLAIRNSDPLLHTVRAKATANSRFNVATPVQGIEITRTFPVPEVMVPIGCDMHPWMHAYVGVLDHPFFDVTGDSGRFSIEGLPPGAYTLEIWHERLGTETRDVTLAEGETLDLPFTFTLPG
jgi:hypothetical protein